MKDHPHRVPKSRMHVLAADGVTVGASGTQRYVVPIFGSLRVRVRALTTANGGTLAFAFVKPDSNGKFPEDGSSLHADTASKPTDLTVTTTEGSRDIDLYGEAYLDLLYTDSGSGTSGLSITVSQL